MIQQGRRLFSGAWTLTWTICVLMVALAIATPAQAAYQPTANQNTVMQVTPSAKVAVRRAYAWAGPGRGFWVLGLLSGGEVIPVTGVSADRQWWQVNTQFGLAYVFISDVTAANVENVPVVDPGAIGKVTAGRAVIRGGPGIEARQVGAASRGMQFYILGTRPDGKWIEIKYRFGTGWIATSLTDVTTGTSGVVTAPVTVGDPRVIVNAGWLNIRSGPSLIFTALGRVPGGTTMKIIGKTADGVWLLVESPFGQGWVNGNHVITKDYYGSVPVVDSSATGGQTEAIFKALGGTANFRSGPGTSFSVVFTANAGEKFKILGQSANGWWYVEGPQGKGWVNKSLGQASGAVNSVPMLQ
jgi:uncharacterized protein YgiM (DUF1202 family)